MTRRLTLLAAASALGLALLTGCQPDPVPTPTATGFADEDAAFAAAEATYRAYVDALNQVDLSDPATFEEVYKWTTGDANAQERESLSRMHADGWTVSGETKVLSFAGDTFESGQRGAVTAVACTDVHDVQLVDAGGNSQVGADRADVYQLEMTLEQSTTTTTGLVIVDSTAVESTQCG